METIHLSRKSVKKFKLENKEYIMCLDSMTVRHYQKTYKKGFLKLLEELKASEQNGEAPIYEILQLLGSCVRHATGQPVGMKFLQQFDEFMLVQTLSPLLFDLYEDNLPKAKDDSEKK